jgi:hypothetical protein
MRPLNGEPCALPRMGFGCQCVSQSGIPDHWVASMPRLAFEGLELCDGKLSRTVLRGLGASDGPRLPGVQLYLVFRQDIPKLQ